MLADEILSVIATMPHQFTVADVATVLVEEHGLEGTMMLDAKIRYQLTKLDLPKQTIHRTNTNLYTAPDSG